MSHVIAICGMMGSGKSTVVARLSSVTPNCVVLHEDDFNPAPMRSLEQVQAWWERGANVAEFDLSQLGGALQQASENPAVVVLLETQFGRLHPTLRPFIDLQCWIDVEPDIALARKISQLATQAADTADVSQNLHSAAESLRWVASFCQSYYQTTRKLFLQQRTNVASQSDIQIFGHVSPDEVCLQFQNSVPGFFQTAA